MYGWKGISIIVLGIFLAAGCGAVAPASTPTPLPSPTRTPFPTMGPVEFPTVMPTPTETAPLSTGTPSVNDTAAPSQTPTTVQGDQMTPDPVLTQLVVQARADLAQRLGLSAESIHLSRAEAVEWPDSSLGCPKPGFMYSQIVTPGYLIVLEANGTQYEYHADRRRASFCQK